jgi:cytochrome c oxidase subunit 4
MHHARGYLIVFAVLLILTALTVAVSAMSLTGPLAIALGVSIATAKAALVAMFFMHLKYEPIIVYTTLAFTAVFVWHSSASRCGPKPIMRREPRLHSHLTWGRGDVLSGLFQR